MIEKKNSAALLARAAAVIPGAVNSPVRAWKAVGGATLFIARGEGAMVIDADGNRFIDYVGSYGPAILGHAHPEVVAALAEQAARGFGYGAPTELEIAIAERIAGAIPMARKVRLVSSGTEAGMTAIRLARAATGRSAYHQVRRLLSRPQRRPAGARRFGRDDPGRARQRRST